MYCLACCLDVNDKCGKDCLMDEAQKEFNQIMTGGKPKMKMKVWNVLIEAPEGDWIDQVFSTHEGAAFRRSCRILGVADRAESEPKMEMTKKEALEKIIKSGLTKNHVGNFVLSDNALDLINGLEALGLLKFKEEKKTVFAEVVEVQELQRCGITTSNIKALDATGYQIVRKDHIVNLSEGI